MYTKNLNACKFFYSRVKWLFLNWINPFQPVFRSDYCFLLDIVGVEECIRELGVGPFGIPFHLEQGELCSSNPKIMVVF